jgi:hypothetical protein
VSDAEKLYVKVTDTTGANTVEVYPDGNDLARAGQWYEWNINLEDINTAGLDMTSIADLTIGIGDGASPVTEGQMFFDDIRVYKPRCVFAERHPTSDIAREDCTTDYYDLKVIVADWLKTDYTNSVSAPNDANLVAHYEFDDYSDSTANAYHGTAVNNVSIVYDSDRASSVLEMFGGDDSYVSLPNSVLLDNVREAVSVAFWEQASGKVIQAGIPMVTHEIDDANLNDVDALTITMSGSSIWWDTGDPNVNAPNSAHAVNYLRLNTAPDASIEYSKWNHWVFTKENIAGPNNVLKIYQNGQLLVTGDLNRPIDVNGGYILRIGGRIRPERFGSMSGKIDDLRIYDMALTAPQALYLASGGTGGTPVPSDAELYSAESPGSKQIDFKDYAIMAADAWFEELLWPEN